MVEGEQFVNITVKLPLWTNKKFTVQITLLYEEHKVFLKEILRHSKSTWSFHKVN